MLFLDFLLLVMTILCVVYCWILNKRIQDLQNSRVEFARMIKELNASIVKAENNVNEMTELSNITSKKIEGTVEEAKQVSAELIAVSELANELVTKLQDVNSSDNFADSKTPLSSTEKFTDEDLPPIEAEDNINYKNHLKNFIHTIVSKKTVDKPSSSGSLNYYDTLRKIKAKK